MQYIKNKYLKEINCLNNGNYLINGMLIEY